MESDDLNWVLPAKKRKKSEKTIELAFVRWCQQQNIMQMKLADLGKPGFPDRTVFLGGGRIVCIEFKKPGGRSQPRQEYVQGQLADHGIPTIKTDKLEDAIQWVLSHK